MLNEVFSVFDELVDEFGLEKIKTVGDCYMVAAGVPDPRSGSRHRAVRIRAPAARADAPSASSPATACSSGSASTPVR